LEKTRKTWKISLQKSQNVNYGHSILAKDHHFSWRVPISQNPFQKTKSFSRIQLGLQSILVANLVNLCMEAI
jgi:hypothetical protein